MDIEEAKRIYMHLDPAKQFISGIDTDFFFNFAYVVLSELDKKDKIINAMAEEYSLEANTDVLDICACCNHNTEDCHGDYCKEALINYFTKKVEG